MPSKKQQGLFITFEGGEGAGKTTLISKLFQFFESKGYVVVNTREPGGTQIGESIRSLLLEHKGPLSAYAELCLFLASRAQHIREVIGPALESGKVVLCDRFNDSSIAYQGVGRGLGVEKVSQMCEFISQGLKPHLTLYLDLDPEVGLGRASKVRKQDRIEAEAFLFHQKIREAFLQIHKAEPTRFYLIDAGANADRVFGEALQIILSKIGMNLR